MADKDAEKDEAVEDAETADEPDERDESEDSSEAEEPTPEAADDSAGVIKLHHLKPAPGSKKKRIRVGRGEGGRRGKTAGRGTKGQLARNQSRLGFEGGQMPLHRRLPKAKGFKNPFRVEFNVINVSQLADFPAGSEVSPQVLEAQGLVHHKGLVKILGTGELSVALNVKAHAFSKSARDKIEAAGGTAEVV